MYRLPRYISFLCCAFLQKSSKVALVCSFRNPNAFRPVASRLIFHELAGIWMLFFPHVPPRLVLIRRCPNSSLLTSAFLLIVSPGIFPCLVTLLYQLLDIQLRHLKPQDPILYSASATAITSVIHLIFTDRHFGASTHRFNKKPWSCL